MDLRIRYCTFIILTILFSFGADSHAQNSRCLTQKYYNTAITNNPELALKNAEFLQSLSKRIKQGQYKKSNAVVTLPIVFHVIYNTTAQNIDSLQIASQIDVLNADFRKMNENVNILQGGFVNLAADVEIEFQLATTDPSGNPTNGITRKVTTNPAIGGSDTDYYDPAKGGVAAWDPERYINIWVLNINSAGGDFGFATFPGMADPVSSDGCVIDFKYLGTTGTAATSQPQHLGRTLTHELGHYFGLFHIWGDVDDCSADDEIADTPLQETSTESCVAYPFYDDCTTTGDGVNFYNYMDYTDDECMAMFTNDQKSRMQAVLSMSFAEGGRSELTQLFSSTTSIDQKDLSVYPNPTSGMLTINLDESVENGAPLSIFDITGKRVLLTTTTNRTMNIDLSALSEGIYITLITSKRTVWTSKVIVIND